MMSDSVRISPAAADAVRVLQLTDTHIASDPAERYDGVDTAATLEGVIRTFGAHGAPPDLVLLTGDLVDDPAHAAYERLVGLLEPVRAPIFCLPGNHDDPEILRSCMNRGRISTPRVVYAAQWMILLLDTWLPGTHGGRLSDAELDFLDNCLKAADGRYMLVCLHHPPVSINSPWMDAMGLENTEAFFSVLDDFENVRAVLWGHIHQEFDLKRRGVRLLGCPSTCVQFLPGAREYIKDDSAPGYRLLRLLSDGRVQTSVVRISASA